MDEALRLIGDYQPSELTVKTIKTTRVVLLVGISGAGKDTIKHKIVKSPTFSQITSHTTRPARVNGAVHEVDGIDYHFIDMSIATNMLKNHDFVEAKLVHGDTIYGTSIFEFEKASLLNQVAIGDVDIQGAEEYLKISNRIKVLFVVPPSYEIWLERLQKRYETIEQFKAEWPKRRESAIKEISSALTKPEFSFVINDTIDGAIELIDQIVYEPSIISYDDESARHIAHDILTKLQ